MFNHSDNLILGVDVGGSHISAALVNASDGAVIEETFCKRNINAHAGSREIIDQWVDAVRGTLSLVQDYELKGIGIAMPGPFDYANGISLIAGVNKYQSLYGLNLKQAIRDQLDIDEETPVLFENDAACFGLGEALALTGPSMKKIIAVTLGTGFGATFIDNNILLKEGEGVPEDGCLYNAPFKDGIAEDYISSRWLIKEYIRVSGRSPSEVKEIAKYATDHKEPEALQTFQQFGNNIATCLLHWLRVFKADGLIMGGSISKSSPLFLPEIKDIFEREGIHIPVTISGKMEISAIAGAAGLVRSKNYLS